VKVELLPGAKCSPKTLLAQMLENADQMEAVVIVPVWKEDDGADSVSAHWSNMPFRTLTFALRWLGVRVDQAMVEDGEQLDLAEFNGS